MLFRSVSQSRYEEADETEPEEADLPDDDQDSESSTTESSSESGVDWESDDNLFPDEKE